MSKSYELFVQEVYQSLVDQSSVKNIRVQHNVVLTGTSTATHQIDVFWEFEIAGQHYRTCVECKHYASSVEKSDIAAFAAILSDIGNANGVFVTTEGYQKGAKLFAQQHGIRLLLMTRAIREVGIDLTLQIPDIANLQLEFDQEGVRAVLKAAGRTQYNYGVSGGEAVLREIATGELCDLERALGTLPDASPARIDLTAYAMRTEIGWMPLKAATFEIKYGEHREYFVVSAGHAVKAIVEDVLANTQSYVDDHGRVT